MIESVKVILDRYGIKEEHFIEAVKELCVNYDLTYGTFPESEFEGLEILKFLIDTLDTSIETMLKKKLAEYKRKELIDQYRFLEEA